MRSNAKAADWTWTRLAWLDSVCHEAVTRGGEEQPCERTAVAVRLDTREGDTTGYPVCRRHVREPLVPLAVILTAERQP